MKTSLAVDGSPYTRRMLDYLASHRELFGAKAACTAMTVVAAVPPQVTHFIAKQVFDDDFSHEAQKILKLIEVFAKRHEHQIATLEATRAQHEENHA